MSEIIDALNQFPTHPLIMLLGVAGFYTFRQVFKTFKEIFILLKHHDKETMKLQKSIAKIDGKVDVLMSQKKNNA